MTNTNSNGPSLELLSERSLRQRFGDARDFQKRKLLWWVRLNFLGQLKPRPVVVLTTSRSGSTWLSDLLARVIRTGPVPEHLRPHHFDHARQLKDAGTFLDGLIELIATELREQKSSGTKIIWDDIPDIGTLAKPALQLAWLEPLAALNPVWIRLRRADRVAQAISRVRAASSGIYHQQTPSMLSRATGNTSPITGSAKLDYNFELIKHHYDILERAEHSLDQLFEALPWEKHTVCYEEVTSQPAITMPAIIEQLRPGKSRQESEQLLFDALGTIRLTVTRKDESAQWHERFSRELSGQQE